MQDRKKKSKQKSREKWPPTLSHMVRSHRLGYLKKARRGLEGNCVFCEIAKGEVGETELLLYKSATAMVVVNKFPYNSGHLMVLPICHESHLDALSDSCYHELTRLIKASVAILRNEYEVENFNVGMNLGRFAGAGIPDHLHTHLIPRWVGDTNFFPLIARTKVLVEEAEETLRRLLPRFRELK